MKIKLLLVIGLATTVGFTSCSKDEEDPKPSATVYGDINTFSARLLGGQTNTTNGSFLDASTGTVYTETAGSANSALIDITYFFGTTNQATLAAPNDADAILAHSQGTPTPEPTELPNWAVKNPTKFKKTTLSSADFLSASNDSLILANGADVTASKVNMLSQDDVLSFLTVDGKKGLIHIQSITGTTGTDRAISINVKIQE